MFRLKQHADQLNLFELDNEPSIEQRDKKKITDSASTVSNDNSNINWIATRYKTEIEMYLKFGFTVNEICAQLIEEHQAPTETYTTGKPKIYPYVMMYLDKLAAQGLCEVKQRDAYEGIYVWNKREDTQQS